MCVCVFACTHIHTHTHILVTRALVCQGELAASTPRRPVAQTPDNRHWKRRAHKWLPAKRKRNFAPTNLLHFCRVPYRNSTHTHARAMLFNPSSIGGMQLCIRVTSACEDSVLWQMRTHASRGVSTIFAPHWTKLLEGVFYFARVPLLFFQGGRRASLTNELIIGVHCVRAYVRAPACVLRAH